MIIDKPPIKELKRMVEDQTEQGEHLKLRLLSNSENLSPTEQAIFVHDNNINVLGLLAGRKDLCQDICLQLINKNISEINRIIVLRQSLPSSLTTKVLEMSYEQDTVLETLVRWQKLDHAQITKLWNLSKPKVTNLLARYQPLSIEQQDEICRSNNIDLQINLARNPKVTSNSQNILLALTQKHNLQILYNLSANSGLVLKLQVKILQKMDELDLSKNIKFDTLNNIIKNSQKLTPTFQKKILEMNNKDLLRALSFSESLNEDTLLRLFLNPDTPISQLVEVNNMSDKNKRIFLRESKREYLKIKQEVENNTAFIKITSNSVDLNKKIQNIIIEKTIETMKKHTLLIAPENYNSLH